MQQVIKDGCLFDEGTLLQVLYHDLTVDRERFLHGCLAMREDQQHSHPISQPGEAATLCNVLLQKPFEALFVEVKLFQCW